MEDVKRIPYGISNFVEVVEQNQYYVDKTMYLPLLEEQPSNLFFIRPRRFGKSIFLSMLRAYYDIAQKEKFDKRFGNLWIGSHPTPMQGQYQVLYLDFSRASGGNGSLAENFDRYCSMAMDVFGKVYEPYYFPGYAKKMEAQPDFVSKLNYLNFHSAEYGAKLYLIIDEYDTHQCCPQRARKRDLSCLDPCQRLLPRDLQEVQGDVRTYLHDRSQSRNVGRLNERIQYRLEYQYRPQIQHDAGIQRDGRTHDVQLLQGSW